MEDRVGSIPNAFYDLIVFVTPSLIFGLGVTVGLGGYRSLRNLEAPSDLNSTVILVVLALVGSYEYGRIAEAWSANIVQRPLAWLMRLGVLKNEDFLAVHPYAYQKLGLEESADGRAADKWVLYLFAFSEHAGIGGDLLKRYAWEKLSRSSAFTYCLLLFASLLTGSLYLLGLVSLPAGRWGFGGWVFTLATTILAMATFTEYYKRNCWNFDMLVKVMPVLLPPTGESKSNPEPQMSQEDVALHHGSD